MGSKHVIYLSFADPPSLMTRAQDQVVLEGDRAITLTCTADGEPVPNITWTKAFANGSDSDVLFTGGHLILSNNRANAGIYRCKASNGIGSNVNHTVKVVVNCEYYIFLCSILGEEYYRALISSYDPHFLHFNNMTMTMSCWGHKLKRENIISTARSHKFLYAPPKIQSVLLHVVEMYNMTIYY